MSIFYHLSSYSRIVFFCIYPTRYNGTYNQEYHIYNNVLPSDSKIQKSLGNGWFVVEIDNKRYLMRIKGPIVLKVVKE